MKVVIMAGGKGTRIAEINKDVPKPMIEINNKPILEYQIDFFEKNNFKDIIIVVGHLKEVIMDYFGNGEKFGVNITYFEEEVPLGTAGSFFYLKKYIHDEDFILVNGDLIFEVDFEKMIDFHKKNKALVTLCTHPNNHPYDSAIIVTDNKQNVIKWLNKEDERTYYSNRVNSGIHILNSKILDYVEEPKKTDLDRDILKKLVNTNKMFAYDTPEYIKDMGTPDRYFQVSNDLRIGKVSAKNLKNKQKAFFIDRDGVINKYVGFLRNIDQFELIDDVAEGIKLINESGYLAIIVTNQPVIARGEVTEEQLNMIHNKMETLLGEKGAYIDKIYYCPHHPHKGYEGEIPELKIECDCRKPKPGMILKAAKDYNISLKDSYMVGDSGNDILAGKNAKCKTILINENNLEYGQDYYFNSFYRGIKKILSNDNK